MDVSSERLRCARGGWCGGRRGVMSAVVACAVVVAGAAAGAAGQCQPRWTAGIPVWNGVDNPFVADLKLVDGGAGGAGAARVLFGGRVANPADGTLAVVGIWNAADQSAEVLARQIDGFVRTVVKLPSGDVLVGGSFAAIDGVAVRQVARWNGSNWAAMGPGLGTGPGTGLGTGAATELGGTVENLVVLADGSVLAMGSVAAAGVNPIRGIARWDGAAWRAMGDGLLGTVQSAVEVPGVGLVASGNFARDGVTGLARWNGTNWVGFGGIISGSVGPMVVMADGSLVVGASGLTTAGGTVGPVSRWDGQRWSTLSGLNGSVSDLSVGPDGELLAVGFLSVADGGSAAAAGAGAGAARWDGVRWESYGALQVGLPRKGLMLAGGDVLLAPNRGSVPLGALARYVTGGEAVTITREPPGVVVTCPGGVVELAVEATGAPLPRYEWRRNNQAIPTTVNATARTPVLRFDSVTANDRGWYSCEVSNACGSVTSRVIWLDVGPCACSLADVAGGRYENVVNPDGNVDGSDFVAFINAFAVGDAMVSPQGDVAGGGADGLEPDGTVDAADFVAFVNAFVVGCWGSREW